jgi:hypothetical protein
MESPGRKSAASLSVMPAPVARRLDPPAGMNARQSALWREVVEAKPVDWFSADNGPLLAEYVRAVDMGNMLAIQIDALLSSDDSTEIALQLKPLLDMRDKEAKRATSIATKLRLTNQSRYTPQAAATANKRAGSVAKPWSS